MRINSYKPFVVVSAERADVSASKNFQRHCNLMEYIGYGFVDGVGVTKSYGKERVLILFYYTLENIAYIITEFKQHSVLLVDQFRNSTLLYHEGTKRYCGVWTEITEPEADAIDHTMVLGKYFKDGKPRYYTCK